MADPYKAGQALGSALFGSTQDTYTNQLGRQYQVEQALQQARQARSKAILASQINEQRAMVNPDLVSSVLGGDREALGTLGSIALLANDNFDAGQLGDLVGAAARSGARDAALGGDWTGANANLMAVANGPQQLATVEGQNVLGNRFVTGGGGVTTTEQGRSAMAQDAAQAANAYASAARTRQAAGIDAAQFALQRSGQWNPGGKSDTLGDGGGKALSAPVITQLTKDADKLTTLGGLSASFKDDFGGSPVLGEWENRLGRAGLPLGDKDQAAWWQQYDRHKNVVRNELFGAALTAAEQEAFDKADITPGMSADTITTNLATQEKVIRDALARKARVYGAQGYNRNALIEATGLMPEVFDEPLGTQPAAKLPRSPGLPAAPSGRRRYNPATGRVE